MERIPVSSRNVASVGFDVESSTLEIEFTNGSVYQYHGVPENVHLAMMNAASKSSYLDQNIKKAGFPFTRVG